MGEIRSEVSIVQPFCFTGILSIYSSQKCCVVCRHVMRRAVESFNWRKSLKGCDSAMLSLLLVLIIIFISTIDSPPTVAQSRFYDRADSLDWWNHRRFHLDGLKPFTAEERKALDNFQSQQVWGRSRGRVRVFYREYDTSTVATRSFLGQVTSRRNYVFFVVQVYWLQFQVSSIYG